MKNNEIISAYTFLGNGVKMSALTKSDVRAAFITFFRALRKIALPILEELKVEDEPAFRGDKEVSETILNEEYSGAVPKIKSDLLMEALSESKVEIPIIAVLNSFDPFLDD